MKKAKKRNRFLSGGRRRNTGGRLTSSNISFTSSGALRVKIGDEARLFEPKNVSIKRKFTSYIIGGQSEDTLIVKSGDLIRHGDLDPYGFTGYARYDGSDIDRALDSETVYSHWENTKRKYEADLSTSFSPQLVENTATFKSVVLSAFNCSQYGFTDGALYAKGIYCGLRIAIPNPIVTAGKYHITFEARRETDSTVNLVYNVNTESGAGAHNIGWAYPNYSTFDITLDVSSYGSIDKVILYDSSGSDVRWSMKNLKIYME